MARSPVKGNLSTSESESSDSQDAFPSQELLGGAAVVTTPKAEKDVDDFDVRFCILLHASLLWLDR